MTTNEQHEYRAGARRGIAWWSGCEVCGFGRHHPWHDEPEEAARAACEEKARERRRPPR